MQFPQYQLLRQKQQLKQQLLTGIKITKTLTQTKTTSRNNQKIKNYSPCIDEFQVSNLSENISLTFPYQQAQPKHVSPSFISQPSFRIENTSILDQFSKCPFQINESKPDQYIAFAAQDKLNILENFMHGRPNRWQNKYQSQAQKTNLKQNSTQTKNIQANNQIITTSRYNPQSSLKQRTPKQNKNKINANQSLIDVSANLSNLIFSHQKNSSEKKKYKQSQQNFMHDDFLKEITEDYQKLEQMNVPTKNQQKNTNMDKNMPVQSKKIKLSRNKHQRHKTEQQPRQKIKLDTQNEIENDQRLNKLLQKKSSIKQLILNQQKKDQPEEEIQTSKWKKNKIYEGDASSHNKSVSDQNSSVPIRASISLVSKQSDLDSSQLMKMLPDYDSSSNGKSGLDPVLEDQLEDIQDSIKYVSEKSRKSYTRQQKQKPVQNIFYGIQQPSEPTTKNKKSQSLKYISLSDLSLQDIEDISEIYKNSEDKLFSDEKQIRKISDQLSGISRDESDLKNPKSVQSNSSVLSLYDEQMIQSPLGQYVKKQSINKFPIQQKQRAIVSEIHQDIKQLKSKVESDMSDYESMHPFEKSQELPQVKSSMSGSQGPGHKTKSMLDFFEELNGNFNLQDIQKDINGLRDKILDNSSFIQ